MELLRRMSTRPDPLDDEQIKKLSSQRRSSSIAIDEDLVLPAGVDPPIECFPGQISRRQETLLIASDSSSAFTITCARSHRHLLTVVTAPMSLPGTSHTKTFYGDLSFIKPKLDRKNSESSTTSTNSTYSGKICTLYRDVMSFRRRHHVDDPYDNSRLIEMEFTSSSWDEGQLKAHIRLLGKYSDSTPAEPIALLWKGRKGSLEGVLEWKHKPVAVCAQGTEVNSGEWIMYVAPGMDLFVASIVIMAVEDRVRRGSDPKSVDESVVS